MLLPHCLLSWSAASEENQGNCYLGLLDTFCTISFLLSTKLSRWPWPDYHNSLFPWTQGLVSPWFKQPCGWEKLSPLGWANGGCIFGAISGHLCWHVEWAGQRQEEMRHRQWRRGIEPLVHSYISSLNSRSYVIFFPAICALHFFLLKLIWVEFLSPTIQGFLNIQHYYQSSCPNQVYGSHPLIFFSFYPQINQSPNPLDSTSKMSFQLFHCPPLFSLIIAEWLRTWAPIQQTSVWDLALTFTSRRTWTRHLILRLTFLKAKRGK